MKLSRTMHFEPPHSEKCIYRKKRCQGLMEVGDGVCYWYICAPFIENDLKEEGPPLRCQACLDHEKTMRKIKGDKS